MAKKGWAKAHRKRAATAGAVKDRAAQPRDPLLEIKVPEGASFDSLSRGATHGRLSSYVALSSRQPVVLPNIRARTDALGI